MSPIPGVVRRVTVGWILVVILALPGCAGVTLQQIAREDPGTAEGYMQLEAGGGFVRVYRGGRLLATRRGMLLQPGDEVETGRNGVAVIRFLDQGEVILAAGTRVRVGSLEVLFGRVFASVRGLFTASSENVVAGVEGTEFVFEVHRDRSVRVVVLSGIVACRSKSGSWATIRLRPRQALTSPYPSSMPPGVEPVSGREIQEIRRWARDVARAPRAGYCCDGGRVFGATSNECRGIFRPTAQEARQECTAFQEGWCCTDGRLTRTARGRCSGRFYSERAYAERVCAPAPEPAGWCCQQGQVRQTTQGRCSGRFYSDRAYAERACATPSQPMGWCCAGGSVKYGPRDACRGTFSTNKATADRACRPVIERTPEREILRMPQTPEPVIK